MSRADFLFGLLVGSLVLLAGSDARRPEQFESRGHASVEVRTPTRIATDPSAELDPPPASLPEFGTARTTAPEIPTAIEALPTLASTPEVESTHEPRILDTGAFDDAITETKELIDENRKRFLDLQREYLNLQVERGNYEFLESGEGLEATSEDWTVAIKYVGGNPVGVRLRKGEFPDYDATIERRVTLRDRLSKLDRERETRE